MAFSELLPLDDLPADRARTVLVTGAGGYIGVPLCRTLLKAGYTVVALDRWFFGQDKVGSLRGTPKFFPVVADLRDCDWAALLPRVGIVCDLAGLSNDASADIDQKLTYEINRDAAIRLASAAKELGVARYVYSSSASVYGAGVKDGLTEEDECAPQTAYAISKLAVERALKELTGRSFRPVILRNATVFGLAPRMRFDLAINIMTLRAWKDRVIYIMGGGAQWRPFVHVEDVVDVFLKVLELPAEVVESQTFNVGSDTMNYRISQIAGSVQDVIPNVAVHRIPDDPDKRSYNLSFSKISETLGFAPKRFIHEGIVEIKQALERSQIDPADPTAYTLQWYEQLTTWERRISELTHKGRVL